MEQTPLLDWFAENYKRFGAFLEIVSDKTQEGAQYIRGFGGIGGLWNKIQQLLHANDLVKLFIAS